MSIQNEVELNEMNARQQRAIENNGAAALANGALDFSVLLTIFATLSQKIFEELLRFIFFPVAAALAGVNAALAWRHAKLNDYKSHTVARAAVETVAAVAITTAVTLGLAATATVAAAAPIIFTVVAAGRTLFNAGSAIYNWGKSATEKDPIKKAEYKERAKEGLIHAVVGSFVTAAIATVFAFGKVALAGIGVAASAVGLAYMGIKGFQLFRSRKKAKSGYQPLPQEDNVYEHDHEAAPALRSSASIQDRLAARCEAVANDAVVEPVRVVANSDIADGSQASLAQQSLFAESSKPVVTVSQSVQQNEARRLGMARQF